MELVLSKKLKVILDAKLNANKKQFVLKSPAITFILPEIKKMYPNAKYIHLYRHGVAVARSWAKKEYLNKVIYAKYYSEDEFVLKCAEYYNDSILEIEQFLEHIPQEDKYHISYEKLSKSPKEELASLLNFIGVNTECTFDLNQIQSTNYKMDLLADDEKLHLEAIMQTALSKLGYM
ncbi:sulfotransferase family protein [Formosa algae]|uniref:sulfotransferase family protein n=1 Tax=Formosa algae TaxID=225843 RepID=UPI000CCF2922|nr:sulfotransferase [Formosa algae]PNW26186.1 hypothetical protein BKP44_17825 [Formosa algae]